MSFFLETAPADGDDAGTVFAGFAVGVLCAPWLVDGDVLPMVLQMKRSAAAAMPSDTHEVYEVNVAGG